jgi:tRNA threonylcarbamoyladenosine biosynthesis protein TsaE
VTVSLRLPELRATESLAHELARALPENVAGWIILLEGELGSGKSTLARAMLRELGHTGTVPSPTYTLIEPYCLDKKTVYHIDLYRISDPEELDYLGWSDLEDGLRLIEWPERAEGLADQSDVRIRLRYDGNGRTAELQGTSDRGKRYLARLALPTVSFSP